MSLLPKSDSVHIREVWNDNLKEEFKLIRGIVDDFPLGHQLESKYTEFAQMAKLKGALANAQTCIKLEPGWAKAHFREGAAWKALKDFEKAAEAFSRASAIDPGNKEIQEALREVLADLMEGLWPNKLKVDYSLPSYT